MVSTEREFERWIRDIQFYWRIINKAFYDSLKISNYLVREFNKAFEGKKIYATSEAFKREELVKLESINSFEEDYFPPEQIICFLFKANSGNKYSFYISLPNQYYTDRSISFRWGTEENTSENFEEAVFRFVKSNNNFSTFLKLKKRFDKALKDMAEEERDFEIRNRVDESVFSMMKRIKALSDEGKIKNNTNFSLGNYPFKNILNGETLIDMKEVNQQTRKNSPTILTLSFFDSYAYFMEYKNNFKDPPTEKKIREGDLIEQYIERYLFNPDFIYLIPTTNSNMINYFIRSYYLNRLIRLGGNYSFNDLRRIHDSMNSFIG